LKRDKLKQAEWEYEKVYKRYNGGDIPLDWPITREDAKREFDFANKVVFEARRRKICAEGPLFGAIRRNVGSDDVLLCERLAKRAVDLRIEAFEERLEAFCRTTPTDPGGEGGDLAETRQMRPSGVADGVETSKQRENDTDADENGPTAGLAKNPPFPFKP